MISLSFLFFLVQKSSFPLAVRAVAKKNKKHFRVRTPSLITRAFLKQEREGGGGRGGEGRRRRKKKGEVESSAGGRWTDGGESGLLCSRLLTLDRSLLFRLLLRGEFLVAFTISRQLLLEHDVFSAVEAEG